MKKPIALFVVFLGLFFLLSNKAQASVFAAHLYYSSDQKNLKFDNTYPDNISLDSQKFISVFDFSDESNPGEYVAKLYDNTETILISGFFTAKAGAFSLDIPYISIADSLKIFSKSSGKELLSANLEQFITCNRNGICEFEKGETEETCLVDCATGHPIYSQQTTDLLKQNNGVIKNNFTGDILLKDTFLAQEENPTAPATANQPKKTNYFLLILSVILVISALAYIIYKKFIKK
jgi:hypothetical protein